MAGFFREREKREKAVFFLLVAAAALLIFIFNILTPMMTDDLFYGKTVSGATSLWDLVLQEKEQYMTWTGRSVCHMLLRLFLSTHVMVFKVANSLAFVLLTLLIYWNVEGRKAYDGRLYLLINLLIWMFGVVFRQTVLWETGACNYLWGSVFIMGFVTLYRFGLQQEKRGAHSGRGRMLRWALGMPFAGLLAGWCNENTSGGGILLVLFYLGFYLYENGKRTGERRRIFLRPWMITGLLGQLAGFGFMILAPGNAMRAQAKEEEHSGLLAYAARFQKITLALEDNFLILLIFLIILFLIIRYQKGSWKNLIGCSMNGILWTFVFAATCYALVLTPEPMPRAYFGAGIFLITAVAQLYTDVSEKEALYAVMKTGVVSVMLLLMFFTYMECGAHLARICREYRERDAWLVQMAQEGVRDVTVPMLRPAFENKYSDGYNSDIGEDPGYWINVAYAQYYGFDSITGVPREDWTEY